MEPIAEGVGTNATKISPDNACEMLKVYGTKEGQERFRSKFMSASSNKPIFKYIERLSSYQLKAYASCSLTKLQAGWNDSESFKRDQYWLKTREILS